MDTLDVSEVTDLLNEAIKRNDRTYAMLVELAKQVPEVEGDIRRGVREVEEHQQAVRKGLIRLRTLVKQRGAELATAQLKSLL